MTSDCYAILGVHPAAEEVVIGAAYRALMRHYHPDTNPDPAAQARAREITAAYAVLRDPVKRAEYDARRAEGDLWSAEDDGEHSRKPPPAMRTVGIAAAALALALVAVAWTLAEKSPAPQPAGHSPPGRLEAVRAAPDPAYPAVQLEPESERLARLREQSEAVAPPPVAPPPEEALPPSPIPVPTQVRPSPPAPRPVARARSRPTRKIAPAPPAPNNERLAKLDTMAAGFLAQSLGHATDAKKVLLIGARNRSAARRKACRSDSCVADALVRQIRETSAIMESPGGPSN